MGNSAARSFQAVPVESSAIVPGSVIHAALRFKSSQKLQVQSYPCKMTTVVYDESGVVIFTAKASPGFRKLKVTITDANDNVVAVASGKDGFTNATAQVLRPVPAYTGQPSVESGKLYPFGTIEIKKSLTTATASYGVISDGAVDPRFMHRPVYQAKKLTAMQFLLSVTDTDGTLVSKVMQPGYDPTKLVVELGDQVDPVAVALLATFVGAATGSNGAAIGGLAGAGVI